MDKIIKIIIFFFFVGFFSDIILNLLSSKYIPSLVPYFKNKTTIEAGIYAGLTILSAIIPLILISKKLFGEYIPNNNNIIIIIILGFIIGYIYDIIIDKFNIFGEPLKPFYKEYGSGFLGGASVVFTILVYKFMVFFVKDF
jgi:hypothetical protein